MIGRRQELAELLEHLGFQTLAYVAFAPDLAHQSLCFIDSTLLALQSREGELARRALRLRLAEIGGEKRKALFVGKERFFTASTQPRGGGPGRMVLEKGGETAKARAVRVQADRCPIERDARDLGFGGGRIGIAQRHVALAIGGDGELRGIRVRRRDEGRQRGERRIGIRPASRLPAGAPSAAIAARPRQDRRSRSDGEEARRTAARSG